jgi:parallel beta-helix repeat protein
MLKRFLLLLIAGVFSGVFYIFFIYSPRELIVPQKYSSIQKAVDKSRPKDTIIISPGVYEENITATRPIQIQGYGGEKTIIKGSLDVNVKDYHGCPAVTAVRKLNFENTERNTINSDGGEILIEECIIRNSKENGIALSNGNNAVITNCQVSDCNRFGIQLYNVVKSSVTGNTSNNNAAAGILIQNARQCSVEENKCYQNNERGIYLYRCTDSIILKNKVSQNKSDGITIQESEGFVGDNYCENNQENGIFLYGEENDNNNVIDANINDEKIIDWSKTKTRIVNNTCINNNWVGIYPRNWNKPLIIEKNLCENGNNSGIATMNSTGPMLISENISRNNAEYGIYAKESDKISVRENKCDGNKKAGIFLETCKDSVIAGNSVSQNKYSGIAVNGTDCIIENNRCINNEQCGIYLEKKENQNAIKDANTDDEKIVDWSKTKTRIVNNICINNKSDGIDLYFWKTPAIISENICKYNIGGEGISVRQSEKISVEKNKCNGNERDGIYFSRCKNCIISENIASQNEICGVAVYKTDSLLENNYCISNRQSGIYIFDDKNDTNALSDVNMDNENAVDWSKAKTVIANNTCIDNKHHGIVADSWKTSAVIEKNCCQYNESLGILIKNSHSPVRISENVFQYNTEGGVKIFQTALVSVEKNNIEKNGESGIYVLQTEKTVTIVTNSICGNYEYGLDIQESARVIIKSNKVEKNAYEGLVAGFGDINTTVEVVGNVFRENYPSGMIFVNGAAGEIRENECLEHSWSGIAIRGKGTEPIVSGNKCSDNQCWGIVYWDGAKPSIENNNLTEGNGLGGTQYLKEFDKLNGI